MAHGLEVYRPDGSLRLAGNDRIIRHVLSVTITKPDSNDLFYSVPGMEDNDTWGIVYADPVNFAGPTSATRVLGIDVTVTTGGFIIKGPWAARTDFTVFRI